MLLHPEETEIELSVRHSIKLKQEPNGSGKRRPESMTCGGQPATHHGYNIMECPHGYWLVENRDDGNEYLHWMTDSWAQEMIRERAEAEWMAEFKSAQARKPPGQKVAIERKTTPGGVAIHFVNITVEGAADEAVVITESAETLFCLDCWAERCHHCGHIKLKAEGSVEFAG